MRNIKYLVIHCSATRANIDQKITLPGEDIGAKEIDRWHRTRGFNGIGYHYVIRRNGTVENGRPVEKAGAHVRGFNSNSIGICLVGGVDDGGRAENNFEPPQWEALRDLLTGLRSRFPRAEIKGHRDFPGVAKDCPCFDVRAWLADEGLA